MSALFFPVRASPVKMGWFLLFLTFEREKNIIFDNSYAKFGSKGNNSNIFPREVKRLQAAQRG